MTLREIGIFQQMLSSLKGPIVGPIPPTTETELRSGAPGRRRERDLEKEEEEEQ
jgi:hypothetical protein